MDPWNNHTNSINQFNIIPTSAPFAAYNQVNSQNNVPQNLPARYPVQLIQAPNSNQAPVQSMVKLVNNVPSHGQPIRSMQQVSSSTTVGMTGNQPLIRSNLIQQAQHCQQVRPASNALRQFSRSTIAQNPTLTSLIGNPSHGSVIVTPNQPMVNLQMNQRVPITFNNNSTNGMGILNSNQNFGNTRVLQAPTQGNVVTRPNVQVNPPLHMMTGTSMTSHASPMMSQQHSVNAQSRPLLNANDSQRWTPMTSFVINVQNGTNITSQSQTLPNMHLSSVQAPVSNVSMNTPGNPHTSLNNFFDAANVSLRNNNVIDSKPPVKTSETRKPETLENLKNYLQDLIRNKNDLRLYYQEGTQPNRILVDILCFKKFRNDFLKKSNNTILKGQIRKRLGSVLDTDANEVPILDSIDTEKSRSIKDIFDTLIAVTTLKEPEIPNPPTIPVVKREPGLEDGQVNKGCKMANNIQPVQSNFSIQSTYSTNQDPFHTSIEELIRMADEAAEPFTNPSEPIPEFRPIVPVARDVKPRVAPINKLQSLVGTLPTTQSFVSIQCAGPPDPSPNLCTGLNAVVHSSSPSVAAGSSLLSAKSMAKPSPRKILPKKTKDIVRPISPNNMCRVEAEDQSHICSSLIESKVCDKKSQDLLKVKKDEVICALASGLVKPRSTGKQSAKDRESASYYWCNFCVYQTDNKSKLVNHVISAHRFACQFCTFQCYSRADVVEHTITTHKEETDLTKDFRYCVLLPDYLKILEKIERLEHESFEKECLQSISSRKTRITPPEDEESCIESDWEEEVLGEYDSASDISLLHNSSHEMEEPKTPEPFSTRKRGKKRKIKRAVLSSSSEEESDDETHQSKTKRALEELKRQRKSKEAKLDSQISNPVSANQAETVKSPVPNTELNLPNVHLNESGDSDVDLPRTKNLRKRNVNSNVNKTFDVLDEILGEDNNEDEHDDDDNDADFVPEELEPKDKSPVEIDKSPSVRDLINAKQVQREQYPASFLLVTATGLVPAPSTILIGPSGNNSVSPAFNSITTEPITIISNVNTTSSAMSTNTSITSFISTNTTSCTLDTSTMSSASSIMSTSTISSTSSIMSTSTISSTSSIMSTSTLSSTSSIMSTSTLSSISSPSSSAAQTSNSTTAAVSKLCLTKHCIHCEVNSTDIQVIKKHSLENHPASYLGVWQGALNFVLYICPDATCEFYASMSGDFMRHISKCPYKTSESIDKAVKLTTEYIQFLKERRVSKSLSLTVHRDILNNLFGKSSDSPASASTSTNKDETSNTGVTSEEQWVIVKPVGFHNDISISQNSETITSSTDSGDKNEKASTATPTTNSDSICTSNSTSSSTTTTTTTTSSTVTETPTSTTSDDASTSDKTKNKDTAAADDDVGDEMDTDAFFKCAFCSFKSMGNAKTVRLHTIKHHPDNPLFTINLKAVEEGKKARFVIFCVGENCEHMFSVPKEYLTHVESCAAVKSLKRDTQLLKTNKFAKLTIHKL